MRVLFWVQHLLGSGHLKRAATLARALVGHGLEVTLVSGGPPAPWLVPQGVRLIQLPAVQARDLAFSALVDEADRPLDDALRAARRARLLGALEEVAPQVVITEMFPFGRRGFLFELVPLLEAVAVRRPRPWVLASVRDILVTKTAPERYAWMRDLALGHYDRVLVHTDPALVPFDLTFPYAAALGARLVSTGYLVEAGPPAGQGTEVLVSAGGGRVGGRLLATALEARPLSRLGRRPWRLIAGGASAAGPLDALAGVLPKGVVVEQQRDDFQALLA
jgi:predicted glycosyltransferase